MENKERRRTRVVVGNILPFIHAVNMHKNREKLGLTVVILPSIRRKEKTTQYLD